MHTQATVGFPAEPTRPPVVDSQQLSHGKGDIARENVLRTALVLLVPPLCTLASTILPSHLPVSYKNSVWIYPRRPATPRPRAPLPVALVGLLMVVQGFSLARGAKIRPWRPPTYNGEYTRSWRAVMHSLSV